MDIFKEPKHRTILEATEEELLDLKNKAQDKLWKPIYHIHPQYGLLNDPNGLAYFNGKYHVFHQWYPFGVTHGMKHWAHLESDDLVTWERLPVAIIPTEKYESHGAYSGNSIEINGELYLYYTGNIKFDKENRSANQCLAIMNKDGEIKKYEGNPIIEGVPSGYTGHVRDPKVFKIEDKYYMILGAQRIDETGTFIVYKSNDGIAWGFMGELELENFPKEFGYMWECPDYTSIDGKDVLIFSPQGIEKQGNKYNNIFNVIYAIGKLDIDNLKFRVDVYEELDKGFDFYAPQSFKGKDGQTLLLAWAGMGEFKYPTDEKLWAHCLTFPRELSIHNNKLIQKPVKEIEKLSKVIVNQNGVVNKNEIIENESNTYYLKINLSLDKANSFGIKLCSSNEESLNLNFNKELNSVSLDRNEMKHKFIEEYGLVREAEINIGKNIDIEVIVDKSIIEIFIDGGKITMSTRVFPLEKSTGIEIYTDDKIEYNYTKYMLNSGILD
ncbi:glycoside hydrolase family 32 protein [Clostridium nigeriense]|uniref:glycoside hydrolase family 32 protein n=1 Tax=Clostridium nigeriense TaxID=1805470 RepID=UPI003D349132